MTTSSQKNLAVERVIQDAPGFLYLSCPTPTTSRYVFASTAHRPEAVCLSRSEAFTEALDRHAEAERG